MQRFSKILFVASPAADDDAAFERTVRLAEAHQAGLTVVDLQPASAIMPVDAPDGVTDELVLSALADTSAEILAGYREAAGDRVSLHTETLFGVGFVEVVRAVLRDGHDLVVKAAQPTARARDRLFGSLDMHLLRKCPVPVWLARPAQESGRYRRILAPVDLDPNTPESGDDSLNRRILDTAAGQAIADGAELHIAHAWQPAHEGILRSRGIFSDEAQAQHYVQAEGNRHRAALDHLAGQLRGWIGAEARDWLKPHLHLRQGNAGEVIPEMAAELHADLVVMGTVGRTGIAGLLIGNTAETILDGLPCSVLAVKPPGFRTPIEPA